MPLRSLLPLLLFWLHLFGCTDSEIYAQTGIEQLPPNRVAITGELCTEDTSGAKFPVKVLVMMDTSARMDDADATGARFDLPGSGLRALIDRYRSQPHVRFGFVSVGTAARAVPAQEFYLGTDQFEIDQAILQLSSATAAFADLSAAMLQAEAFITNDIANASPGATLRTRYIIYLMVAGPPPAGTTANELAEAIEKLRDLAFAAGALELRLHLGFLYYGPAILDPAGLACYAPASCTCAAGDTAPICRPECDLGINPITDQDNVDAQQLYQSVAFAGGGQLREFSCPADIDFNLDVSSGAVHLLKKDIVAYNQNVRLGAFGTVTDSDGDGLADREEGGASPETDDTLWDTDGDGLGDRLEFRAAPEQDPTRASDRPASCVDPATSPGLPDADLDLLNDCEEGLLQSSPSVPDTDGDGLPDLLEFLAGTVPTAAEDRLMDFDGDGVPNAREVLEHTNPRAHDGELRGIEGYRNRVDPVGLRPVATMANAPTLRGINFRVASANVLGGQGYLRWQPCTQRLEWSDVRFSQPPVHTPVPETIDGAGIYRLEARAANGAEIWVEVFVAPELLPTCADGSEFIANPLISVSERTCYDVRISNIKLHQTLAANGEDDEGLNHILVFFTQAPEDRLSSPGVSKVAEVRVRFVCAESGNLDSCERSVPGGEIILNDTDFVAAVP